MDARTWLGFPDGPRNTQALFGVGRDDVSISTIDPAGIALAAIQELHKRNNELKSQVSELKQLVELLVTERK